MTSATLSHADVSRSRPPRTACSASTECGGSGASASENTTDSRSRRVLPGPATGAYLLFGDDRHCQRHIDVRMQMQNHRMVADRTQSAVRKTNFAALDLDAGLGRGFRDVRRADGAEELALGTRLRRDDELEILQLLGALFSGREVLVRSLFELGTTGFKPLDVVRRGQSGLARRQQV